MAVLEFSSTYALRRQDWRNGPVIYQVIVDRFAPSGQLDSKAALYRPPRRLHEWRESPVSGQILPEYGLWSHELDFWGGDLSSLNERLEYLDELGVHALYLTPIFQALSNHKYDTQDYLKIDPQIGTSADLESLVTQLHGKKRKLILDGVFNHMGRTSPRFQEALKSPRSAYRNWFYFDQNESKKYRGWAGTPNLPALRLENPQVRDYLWNGKHSVVKHYLTSGIDGWRLDVGFELGHENLAEITKAAHAEKPDSVVVGEISGYPAGWFPAVDGVFNFFSIDTVKAAIRGEVSGGRASRLLGQTVEDAGIDHALKSWLLTDNHDTPRLADTVSDLASRKFIFAMQFTLPGSPVLYYGTELGMTGAGDPMNRAPMRWDLVREDNELYQWTRRLSHLREANPALRYGDFKPLETEHLIGFARTSGSVRDDVLVIANPLKQAVTEVVATRMGKWMSWGNLTDLISGKKFRSIAGLLTVDLSANQVVILKADTEKDANGASPYNRVP